MRYYLHTINGRLGFFDDWGCRIYTADIPNAERGNMLSKSLYQIKKEQKISIEKQKKRGISIPDYGYIIVHTPDTPTILDQYLDIVRRLNNV